MASHEIEHLLHALEEAFGSLPIPSPEALTLDSSGYYLECNQITAKFQGRHWRDLSVEDLEGEADSLSFFSPEAFRFFLPAFVRASLLHYDRADLIPMVVVWAFKPPEDRDLGTYYQARLQALARAQKQALSAFISLMRQERLADFDPHDLEAAQDALGR